VLASCNVGMSLMNTPMVKSKSTIIGSAARNARSASNRMEYSSMGNESVVVKERRVEYAAQGSGIYSSLLMMRRFGVVHDGKNFPINMPALSLQSLSWSMWSSCSRGSFS